MFVDTPARIAILGAGPIGLEAALYARSLGYEVVVFERGNVADHVMQWGHVRMFSPFRMNRSSLGLAALAAQDPDYSAPDEEALLTGREWVQRYLLPLSQTDLLHGCVCENTRVVQVGRNEVVKTDSPGDARRAESPFRILLRDSAGAECIETADVVIDTTGVFGHPRWIGRGGIPAVGEIESRSRIEFGLPDFAGPDRHKYEGQHTLLIGSGCSAATNMVALSQLAKEKPGTYVTWITRPSAMARIDNGRLPERDRLACKANELREARNVNHLPGVAVEQIHFDEPQNKFKVLLSDTADGPLEFDRVIANVGLRPDATIYQELQIHQCYASEGPMKLAAVLLGQNSADCLDQTSHGSQTLVNPEPNFYILGAKSYGRNSLFLVSIGLEQIRDVFSIIGGRENLDLYASMNHFIQ